MKQEEYIQDGALEQVVKNIHDLSEGDKELLLRAHDTGKRQTLTGWEDYQDGPLPQSPLERNDPHAGPGDFLFT